MHPFRFAATMPAPASPLADWHSQLRHLEDLGLSSVVAADHFTGGYTFEPMVALTAAAGATTRLRLQTGVLGNDYRHPVLVHRMAALLDVVSDGRLVLGLGAGWMTSDYEAAGIALDPAGVRVSRFGEALAVIKGLFGSAPFDFEGEHYSVHSLDGLPKPVQQPHPPLFVGGGSPRVLRLAGREADIVGINASLPPVSWVRTRCATCRSSGSPRRSAGYVRGRGRRVAIPLARARNEPLVGTRHAQRERCRRPARAHGRPLRRRALGPRRVTVGARRHRVADRRHAPGPARRTRDQRPPTRRRIPYARSRRLRPVIETLAGT